MVDLRRRPPAILPLPPPDPHPSCDAFGDLPSAAAARPPSNNPNPTLGGERSSAWSSRARSGSRRRPPTRGRGQPTRASASSRKMAWTRRGLRWAGGFRVRGEGKDGRARGRMSMVRGMPNPPTTSAANHYDGRSLPWWHWRLERFSVRHWMSVRRVLTYYSFRINCEFVLDRFNRRPKRFNRFAND